MAPRLNSRRHFRLLEPSSGKAEASFAAKTVIDAEAVEISRSAWTVIWRSEVRGQLGSASRTYLFQTPACSASASSSSNGPMTSVGPLAALEHLAARQVERRVLRVIAGDGAQAMFAQAVDQAADSGPVDRARAHRAGFGGRIERRAFEHIRRSASCRLASPAGARHARCRHATACSRSRSRSARCDSDRRGWRRTDDCRGSWRGGRHRTSGAGNARRVRTCSYSKGCLAAPVRRIHRTALRRTWPIGGCQQASDGMRSGSISAPPCAARFPSGRLRWRGPHRRTGRGTSPPGDPTVRAVRRGPR